DAAASTLRHRIGFPAGMATPRKRSLASIEPAQLAAFALVGPARRSDTRRRLQAAILGQALARLPAGFGFAVHGLSQRRGDALVAELLDDDLEAHLPFGDLETVAAAHQARGLGRGTVDFDLAALDGLLGHGTRFEKARRPEPFVESYGVGHGFT